MNSMPTSPSGSSSRKPPALANSGVPVPVYHGRVGSQAVSSSSLVGSRVVLWMIAMRRILSADRGGTHPF